jgi:hypothetical protein
MKNIFALPDTRRRGNPQEGRHLEEAIINAQKAPCNGCPHENFCKEGFSCERYDKWVSIRVDEWARIDPLIYSREPNRPI